MNDFDRGRILGSLNNVTVSRIVKDVFKNRVYSLTMECNVYDENEEAIDNVSTIFTYNMSALRALTFYNNYSGSTARSKTFTETDGSTFSGYYGASGASSNSAMYSANIFGYSPTFYASADTTKLSNTDYAVPEDAIGISYTVTEPPTASNDGCVTMFHAYYTNTGDSAITVNKILVVGQVADGTSSSSSSSSYHSILLFEELLDAPITLATGDALHRNYEFGITLGGE